MLELRLDALDTAKDYSRWHEDTLQHFIGFFGDQAQVTQNFKYLETEYKQRSRGKVPYEMPAIQSTYYRRLKNWTMNMITVYRKELDEVIPVNPEEKRQDLQKVAIEMVQKMPPASSIKSEQAKPPTSMRELEHPDSKVYRLSQVQVGLLVTVIIALVTGAYYIGRDIGNKAFDIDKSNMDRKLIQQEKEISNLTDTITRLRWERNRPVLITTFDKDSTNP